jgi:two-component system chemotaxis sensor kinase CheA
VAIPLHLVARLEEFSVAALENSIGHEVTQYRGEIMPLIRLSEVLGGGLETSDDRETVQVVVYRDNGRSIGLIVEQIADIVEEQILVKSDAPGDHFSGTAVVQGRVTDILNVRGVIESVDPSYLNQPVAA